MAIVGCSNDNTSANNKFATDNHFDFPLLSDTDLSVAAQYGAAKPGGAAAKRVAGAMISLRLCFQASMIHHIVFLSCPWVVTLSLAAAQC